MPDPDHDAERRAVLAWAADYYPARTTRPPDLSWVGPDDVVALFEQCPSRIAYLALVDQPDIRRHFSAQPCTDAAGAAWQRCAGPLPVPGRTAGT